MFMAFNQGIDHDLSAGVFMLLGDLVDTTLNEVNGRVINHDAQVEEIKEERMPPSFDLTRIDGLDQENMMDMQQVESARSKSKFEQLDTP